MFPGHDEPMTTTADSRDAQLMTVSVTVRVTVDREAWTATYGGDTAAQVRGDVKAYVGNCVAQSAAFYDDAITDVVAR
jgi:hypothetical protein